MIILNNSMTLTTNKIVITDKTLGHWGTKKKNNNNTHSLHPNYEKTTLSNMQRKHHVH